MKKLILVALFAALAVALGFALISVPNLELVTFTFFLGGYFIGLRGGILAAVLGEFLYSTFNPLGAAPFPMLVAQIFGMSLVAATGAVSREIVQNLLGAHSLKALGKRPLFYLSVFFGLIGLTLTLIYDFLTTLTPLLFSGLTVQKLFGSVAYGMGFYVAHIGFNTLIFAALTPLMVVKFPAMVHLRET